MYARLNSLREHIVHVMPVLESNGVYNFMIDLVLALPDYAHTLLYETAPDETDPETVMYAQGSGMNVLQTEEITAECLCRKDYTGAILYNVVGHAGVSNNLPSIYYSYGICDELGSQGTDIIVPCSNYACDTARDGSKLALDKDLVVPPMLRTRKLREFTFNDKRTIVAILTSGSYGKYPCKLVMELLPKLPNDVIVLLTTLSKYAHPGMPLAIDSWINEQGNKIIKCAVRPGCGLRYLMQSNMFIHASAEGHYDPYSRMIIEAMSLQVPVICERNFATRTGMVQHEATGLLYSSTDEIVENINRLQDDCEFRVTLLEQAHVVAEQEDVSIHIGKFKRILRSVGI